MIRGIPVFRTLQWGRDREVADSNYVAAHMGMTVELQWGRDREVADSRTLPGYEAYVGVPLQWGRDREVADSRWPRS